jgi:hypothetical protein
MKVDRPGSLIVWTPITLALAALLAGAMLAGGDQPAQAHPPPGDEHSEGPAEPSAAEPSGPAGDDTSGLDESEDTQQPEGTQPPEGERPEDEESDEDNHRTPNRGSGGDTPPDYIAPSDHKMV